MFSSSSPEMALRYGTIGSAVLFIIAAYFTITSVGVSANVWIAVLIGNWWYSGWLGN
jgi:K(+)-stimulated pyrophosphate-energized sodium pump